MHGTRHEEKRMSTAAATAEESEPEQTSSFQRTRGDHLIRWSTQETKMVALECARKFQGARKFTARHFRAGQCVLPVERQKKSFVPSKIRELRRLIAEVPLPTNPDEDTESVHSGGYDGIVQFEPEQSKIETISAPMVDTTARVSPRPVTAESAHTADSAACERLVALLVDINLKALALKGFTARQIEEATSNRIDTARLRNLTIQANNALTYFEQIISISTRW
jgi:hypothetical protein